MLASSAAVATILPESYTAKQFIGGFYAVFLLFLSVALGQGRAKRFPYFRMFVAGMVLGTLWEVAGYLLGLWYYPFVLAHTWAALLLPPFYGIYMIIIANSFRIARRFTSSSSVALFSIVTTLSALIEGINLFTGSWVYAGAFLDWMMLYIAWFPLVLSFEVTAKFSVNRGSRLAWSRIWPSGG